MVKITTPIENAMILFLLFPSSSHVMYGYGYDYQAFSSCLNVFTFFGITLTSGSILLTIFFISSIIINILSSL